MVKLKVYEDSNLFFEDDFSEEKEITVGRGSFCDIVLENHPGISRTHFKITITSDLSVNIELTSKTGRLIHSGENIPGIQLSGRETTISVPPYDFKFEIPLEEAPQAQSPLEKEEPLAKKAESSLTLADKTNSLSASNEFSEDETTKIAAAAPLEYSVKVFKGERLLQELALQGNTWDFGRDQSCHYTIKSKKTSRQHFKITSNKGKFYVKDLGSSNGTFLNKQQLPVNQEIELKSGDYIEVTDFKFIFEIKDHSFRDKMKDISIMEAFGGEDPSADFGQIEALRKNALSINDEFMKLPEKDRPSAIADPTSKKKRYLRPMLLALIILSGGLYYVQNSEPEINVAELASIAEEKRMAKERINAATDKFNLALRFYNESQFERCIFEIDEFIKYDIQTEETAGATELKNQCDIEKDRLQRKRDLEIQEEQRLITQRKIQDLILECTPLAQKGKAALSPCIEPAFNLDPANEEIAQLTSLAEDADIRREQKKANAKKYHQNVAAGKRLYNKAVDYDRFGDWKRALKAYSKHIKSKYPDPKRLKKKSKRSISSINTRIEGILLSSVAEAKKYADNDDYKNAILSANKGLEVNRDHAKLLEIKAKASKNLKIILRKYYQESIIQEDFGQVDEAKIMWKKILSQGVKGSDYYQKAKLKLRYYEEGV